MNLPESAEVLFELPPEDFTAERDRIAKDLKKQGEDESAAVVKALKRPSVTAYALNLVARQHAGLVDDLLKADEDLRGARSRGAMDDAKAARQKAISAITSKATSILGDQDRPITAQVRERLTETLLAVATDDETRAGLKAGRLLREAEGGGFGGPVTAFDAVPEDDEGRKLKERVKKLPRRSRRKAGGGQKSSSRLRAGSARVEGARGSIGGGQRPGGQAGQHRPQGGGAGTGEAGRSRGAGEPVRLGAVLDRNGSAGYAYHLNQGF